MKTHLPPFLLHAIFPKASFRLEKLSVLAQTVPDARNSQYVSNFKKH